MDRLQDIGKDRPDHEVDAVAVEKSAHLLNGDVGLEFVIGDNKLDVAAAHLAAEMLERELEAVFRLLAEHGGRARERIDQTDLDLFLCVNAAGYRQKNRSGG